MIRTLIPLLLLLSPLTSFAKKIYMNCNGDIYKHNKWSATIELRRDGEWVDFCPESFFDQKTNPESGVDPYVLEFFNKKWTDYEQKREVWDLGGRCSMKAFENGRTVRKWLSFDFMFRSKVLKEWNLSLYYSENPNTEEFVRCEAIDP